MSRRPKILIFNHDGRGLGHLSRLSRIASKLQENHAVLVVTGHRAASWLLPAGCEFIHLPNLDSIDPDRASSTRRTFWDESFANGLRFRNNLLLSIIDSYQPDAYLLDYLPIGRYEEMYPFITRHHSAKKYYILRGILGDDEYIRREILTPAALQVLQDNFNRIFVACDRKIVDVILEYPFLSHLETKIRYVGYVVDHPTKEAIIRQRRLRGLDPGQQWVVCSAGGGKNGHKLMTALYKTVKLHPTVCYDFIRGPRATVSFRPKSVRESRTLRILDEDSTLALTHAACDIMVSFGGYNSLVEGMRGKARMIVYPYPNDIEQKVHAERLQQFRTIAVLSSLGELPSALDCALKDESERPARPSLSMTGAYSIAKAISRDLQISPK